MWELPFKSKSFLLALFPPVFVNQLVLIFQAVSGTPKDSLSPRQERLLDCFLLFLSYMSFDIADAPICPFHVFLNLV